MPDSLPPVPSPELITKEPATMYALVRQSPFSKGMVSDAYRLDLTDSVQGNAPFWDFYNCEDEPPYEDCDYDELSGFLVFEGHLLTKTDAYDALTEDEREEFEDSEGVTFDEHESCYQGSWRRMTASELVTIGLVDADAPTPLPAPGEIPAWARQEIEHVREGIRRYGHAGYGGVRERILVILDDRIAQLEAEQDERKRVNTAYCLRAIAAENALAALPTQGGDDTKRIEYMTSQGYLQIGEGRGGISGRKMTTEEWRQIIDAEMVSKPAPGAAPNA